MEPDTIESVESTNTRISPVRIVFAALAAYGASEVAKHVFDFAVQMYRNRSADPQQ